MPIPPTTSSQSDLDRAVNLLETDPQQARNCVARAIASGLSGAQRALAQLIEAEACLDLGLNTEAQFHLDTPPLGALPPNLEIRAMLIQARLLDLRGDARRAQKLLEQAAQRAHTLSGDHTEFPNLRAQALNLLAAAQHRTGSSETALSTLDQVLHIRRTLGDIDGEIRALCNKTMILCTQNHMAEALEVLSDAQQLIATGPGSALSEVMIHLNLGLVHEHMDELPTAMDAFTRGLEIANQHDLKVIGTVVRLNAAEMARKLGNLDQALPLIEDALQTATTLGMTNVAAAAHHSLALLYSAMGKHVDAQRSLTGAEEAARTSGDLDAQLDVQMAQAAHAQQNGKLTLAEEILTRTLALAQAHGRSQAELDLHLAMASLLEEHEPRAAIMHLRSASELSRHLRDADLAAQTRELTNRSALDTARREVEHARALRDAAELARSEAITALEEGRLRDNLTGLPNRVLLYGLLTQEIQAATRDNQALSLVLIDIDRFKMINDELGYPGGDELLRQVAQRLQRHARRGHTVTRSSNNEFIVILPGGTDIERQDAAQVFMAAMEDDFDIDGQSLVITATLGIAHYPQHGRTPEDLQRAAHFAMEDARARGVRTALFSGSEERQSMLVVESALARALEREEFEVHYQPLVDAQSGAPVSAEALLRWNSARVGRRSPAEFIPLLERSGMIVAVGEWVLRTACQHAASWPEPLRIAVNLSARQFQQGNLAEIVRSALADSGLPPHRLELEITESLMVQSPARVRHLLGELKGLGVRVMIDDFGTGYSSLSVLRDFPINGLKIDRSFVQALDQGASEPGKSMLRAIVQMGEALHLDLVAEGVETAAEQRLLCDLGVPVLQGFLFARPTLNWDPE